MARGGRKTPPPPNRTPIVTRSRSQDSIPPQTTTTSTEDPQITVEPATPNPTGGDIQEIFRQSLIKSHKAFASLRQPHRPWSQPLDFSEVREQLGDIDPTVNPTDQTQILLQEDLGYLLLLLLHHLPHLLLLLEEIPLLTKANHLPVLPHLHPQWQIRTTLLDHGWTRML
jgi:hypothetical protein